MRGGRFELLRQKILSTFRLIWSAWLWNLAVGVSNNFARSELQRQSKVTDTGRHVALDNYHFRSLDSISGIKPNYRFLSSKCVTLMRTFFDLKSLWAIDGFTPWPLFAPSSPDWQFSWGQDFKVLLLSKKNRKQTVKVRQSFGHRETYLDQVLN